jgi:DNA-binding NtrC family response regulator
MVRASCERALGGTYAVRMADNGRDGLDVLAQEPLALALVDLKLPDMDGMDILREAVDRFPDVPIIIITGYSTIKSAVEAVKIGAFDYIAKPFTPDELEAAVQKAHRYRRLIVDYRAFRGALADRYHVSCLLGESSAMRRVMGLIHQVAETDSTVLLTGESGTGKELVARAVHFGSRRKDKRFVAVDCGAIPQSLIASELFGHVRGAFTGATADRTGLVQQAHNGTLFLDEIGNLPLELQATLLRIIEDRRIRPVGSATLTDVDVRFIAATNSDLQALVAQGRFREDLYYRLNVFPIHLPPLRDRREDIPQLAQHFLAGFAAKMHKRIDGFTDAAMNLLVGHDWPGNVRELSNVVERLAILCPEGRVGQTRLRESLAAPSAGVPVPQTAAELNELKRRLRDEAVVEAERAFLLDALRRSDYNVTHAAQEAGMQRSNFQALLKKHGLRIRDLAADRGGDGGRQR